MSQAEWPVCEPLLPAPAWPAGRGWPASPLVHARHRRRDPLPDPQRAGLAALPADFPAAWTVYWWADKWQADGSTARLHDDLRERIRLAAGRSKQLSAAVIDSSR